VYRALPNCAGFHPHRERWADAAGSFSPTYSEANYGSLPAVTVAEKEPSNNPEAREFDYLDSSSDSLPTEQTIVSS